MSSERIVYVLFGSQTGNAECVAKDFTVKLSELRLNVKCQTLNSAKGVSFKEALCVIILCSTTGNGDCPENADTWWRSVKLRSAAKDMFSGVKYAVLGLGDTNYDKFCHMGKIIDKRLSELGGDRCLDIHCADEATGLEETIEVWKSKMLEVVKKMTTKPKLDSIKDPQSIDTPKTELVSSRDTTPVGESSPVDATNHLPDGLMSMHDLIHWFKMEEKVATPLTEKELPRIKATSKEVFILPDTIIINNEINRTRQQEKILSKANNGSPSSSSSSLLNGHHTSLLPPPPPSSQSPSLQQQQQQLYSEYTTENPFYSKITNAVWLTENSLIEEGTYGGPHWGETKRVIYMELDLKGSNINYQPGDSIAICCPNPRHLMDIVYERLKIAHSNPYLSLHQIVRIGGSANGIAMGNGSSNNCSSGSAAVEEDINLHELLEYRIDLTSSPKKANILSLSQYCLDPKEKHYMQYLCGKGETSKFLWLQFIEHQQLGLGEILYLFPSCTPTLGQLLACSTSIPPRSYSIASSPLCCSTRAAVAFSVVRTVTSIKHETALVSSNNSNDPAATLLKAQSKVAPLIRRSGLCTTYLEHVLHSYLSSPTAASPHRRKSGNKESSFKTILPDIYLRVFHKPTLTFHLPGSVSHPLILIGPGTGVAPFIGFLQHREILEHERRRSGGEEICCGMWRGGFELNESDLPCESNSVEKYIHSMLPGSIDLFFGCRNEKDYLFKSSLQHFLKNKTLTSLEVAMSRVLLTNGSNGSTGNSNGTNTTHTLAPKVYVTHKIKERGEYLTKLITQEDGAYIYICGDGNHMAKDVYHAFKEILIKHGHNMNEEKAEALLQDMKLRRKYVMDIWSN